MADVATALATAPPTDLPPFSSSWIRVLNAVSLPFCGRYPVAFRVVRMWIGVEGSPLSQAGLSH